MTVLKNKTTRQSKGVAFVLYLDRVGAHAAVNALHNKEVFMTRETLNKATNVFAFCSYLVGH